VYEDLTMYDDVSDLLMIETREQEEKQ